MDAPPQPGVALLDAAAHRAQLGRPGPHPPQVLQAAQDIQPGESNITID